MPERPLWAPWRIQYILGPKREGCVFCAAAALPDDAGSYERPLDRGRRCFSLLNTFPYASGHLMVAPVAHEARLFDSTDASLRALIRLTAEAQRILSDVYHPEGFNVGMNFGQVAGAGVADHYHLHIVQRWGGDTNFMSVTARTRLVPEELDVTFDKLLPQFEKLRKDLFA